VGIEVTALQASDLGSDESSVVSSRPDPIGHPRIIERTLKTGAPLRHGQTAVPILTEVVSGWLCRLRFANNGNRSILDFALPGEMFFSQQNAGGDENVVAITDVRLREVEHPTGPINSPARISFSQSALMASLNENSRLAERLVSIGRRDAFDRMAYLFLELASRSRAQVNGGGVVFVCPLTQTDIGDALGLSTVHVNRVLKEMRSRQLLSLRNGRVELFNYDEFAKRVDYDPQYLHISSELP
jgi:CRP-like cAMP-binding protein